MEMYLLLLTVQIPQQGQFALIPQSLFEAGSSTSLAKKIDFWIENDDYRKEMEIKYSQSAERYRLKNSIIKMEEMFKDAIRECKKRE